MPLLKLNTTVPKPATSDATPAVETPGGGRIKLKIPRSQPPTPAVDTPGSALSKSTGKKRAADGDLASPAIKRVASGATGDRRGSITLKIPQSRGSTTSTPATAGPRIKLQKRKSSGPKLRRLNVKGRIPERLPGNAYDSEDSDRELDPATEQQLVLRMQPGEDCDLLRKAIADRTLGAPPQEGGVEVSFKFLDRDLNRALITIRKNMYAAVLVNMPCIIETMKSWDKRGWWKVADISQMLLVLGQVNNEEDAKHMPLPSRIIDPKTMAYAHGLTPPMHWVRKRRFRKRLTYKDTLNVEEEVNRLLEEDAKVESRGGDTSFEIRNRDSMERSVEPDDYFARRAADNAVDTIENEYDDADGEEVDEMDLDDMEAMFAEHHQNFTSGGIVDSPTALPDPAAAGVRAGTSETPAETPAPTDTEDAPGEQAGEESSDEDEDDDENDDDSVDDIDEDARARAAELNLQKQEIEDLENEIRLQRQTLAATTNQILVGRLRKRIEQFESDLLVKRRAYGFEDAED